MYEYWAEHTELHFVAAAFVFDRVFFSMRSSIFFASSCHLYWWKLKGTYPRLLNIILHGLRALTNFILILKQEMMHFSAWSIRKTAKNLKQNGNENEFERSSRMYSIFFFILACLQSFHWCLAFIVSSNIALSISVQRRSLFGHWNWACILMRTFC